MQLASVEKVPTTRRPKVVAEVIERLLPQPFDEDEATDPEVIAVLEDARAALRGASSRIASSLWDYLADSAAGPKRSTEEDAATFRRLATRGVLSASAYDLKIPEVQFSIFAPFGVRREHIIDAVADAGRYRIPESGWPDPSDHDAAGYQVIGERQAFIVFAARPRAGQSEPFRLVVGTTVQGPRIVFEWAFRAYDEDVAAGCRTPVELMRSVAEHYGRRFRVNGGEWTKFVEHAVRPAPNREVQIERHPDNAHGHYFATMHFRMPAESLLEVSLAFVIDTTAYTKVLRGRGAFAAVGARSASVAA